jgi:PilZ domain
MSFSTPTPVNVSYRFLLAEAYPSLMSNAPMFRRSTRVPIKVAIEVEGCTEPLTCEGVTVVVNLHGALISTALALSVGMKISIHVILTDKRAKGRVVYVDPENALRCGVELDKPRNIWGVSILPDDWDERAEHYVGR